MNTPTNTRAAERVADLTFQLLVHCQIKESNMAADFDMSPSELRALRLFHGCSHLLQKEIVDRVGLSGSRLTRIIDRFQEEGWVTRGEDPDDRRGAVVFLTPAGHDLLEEIEKLSVAIHIEILQAIPQDLHAGLVSSLELMLNSLRGWLKRQPGRGHLREVISEGQGT